MKRTTRFVPACMAILALLIPLCGCSDQKSQEAKVGEETAIRANEQVSVCSLGVASLPLALAQENGLFAAQGVEVIFQKSATGTAAMESMFQGACDLSTPTETVLVRQSFKRQDFSVLATIGASDNSLRILTSRKSGILAPRDLKGKRIFTPKGSVSHFFLEIYLARNDLTLADVVVVTEGVPDATAAFQEGLIDAYCQTDVMINTAKMALGNDALVLSAPGLVWTSFNLAATKRFINERPEAIRRVLAALLENEKMLTQGVSEPIRATCKALGIAEGSVPEIYNNYRWNIGLQQILLLSMEQEAIWLSGTGLVQASSMPNYLHFIHPDFLRSLRPEAVTMLE